MMLLSIGVINGVFIALQSLLLICKSVTMLHTWSLKQCGRRHGQTIERPVFIYVAGKNEIVLLKKTTYT